MRSLQVEISDTPVRGAISIDHASVSFPVSGRPFIALHDVTMYIPFGKTVALVGPSGCGKTTLLNLIAGFALPTDGSLTVGGRPVTRPGRDRAVVFQADAVFPWLTVRKNLEYGPKLGRRRDPDLGRRVEYFLETMGLTQFADEYPKVLSGGMRKRVDVARAYVNQPDVVLLDEPFGALDDMTKTRLQEEVVSLSLSDPKTSVFVTHDIEEAIYVGDEVAVMMTRPGRVQEVIPVPFPRPRPAEIRTTPEFQEMRRHIQQLLRAAHEESA